MTAFIRKTTAVEILAVTAALSVFVSGCSKKTPQGAPQETAAAESVDPDQQTPESDQFSLSELQDNDVVLTVEGEDILYGPIREGMNRIMMRMSSHWQSPPREDRFREVTDDLVADILIRKAAERSGPAVSDEELAKEIALYEADLPEGKTLKEAVAEAALNYDEWVQNLRKEMVIRKMMEEKLSHVPEVTAEQIDRFYQENSDEFKLPENVSVSHILIAVDENATSEVRARKKAEIEQVRADLLAGADFNAIAIEKSDCPENRERGGDWDEIYRDQTSPAFEAAAFTQETGVIGEVVESELGYHIIKVTRHQPERMRPLADVEDNIRALLNDRAKWTFMRAYIEELKSNAVIVPHKTNFDKAIHPQP
jgi:parvulin-like peptidyl-prolyl isomerase